MVGVVSIGDDLLKRGIRWRITAGYNVRVFKDPWLLRPKFFKPITIPRPHHVHLRVLDLMTVLAEWDWERINNILWQVDHDKIKRIPIGTVSVSDSIIWNYTKMENTVSNLGNT